MKARIRRLSVSVDSPFGPTDHNQEDSGATSSSNPIHSATSTLKDTSRIERMRKLLSSPLSSRRKSANALTSSHSTGSSGSTLTSSKSIDSSSGSKIFGAPLSSHPGIPFIITRLCCYIETESGLQQEGLFRISGNVKLIDRLKNSFDEFGDAPLEDIADVPSAAALIKLYLRELPKPVIPSNMHQLLFDAAKDYSNYECQHQQQNKLKQQETIDCENDDNLLRKSKEKDASSMDHDDVKEISCLSDEDGEDEEENMLHGASKIPHQNIHIQKIKSLISILPSANFYTLRYLCSFLHRVSQYESSNRMNAASLGIVFGPTIFRISTEEYSTLGDEAIDGPNQVVTALIAECHTIFDRLIDPSYSTAAAAVVLLDPRQSVILSGSSKHIPSITKTAKKGASIDLCDLHGTKLHQQKRNFSQDDDEVHRVITSTASPPDEVKTVKKKTFATIVPIVVLNHTDDDIETLKSSDTMAATRVTSNHSKGDDDEANNRRKRYLSSNCANLIRSVSEERSTSPVSPTLDPISNELRRCASSDNLIRGKGGKSSTLAAVVAATTASLLFPSYTTLLPRSDAQSVRASSEAEGAASVASTSTVAGATSLQVSSSSSSASATSSPSTHSPSLSDEVNSNTQTVTSNNSVNTLKSLSTIIINNPCDRECLSSDILSDEKTIVYTNNVNDNKCQVTTSRDDESMITKTPINVILTSIDNDDSNSLGNENNVKDVSFITSGGGDKYDDNNNHSDEEKSINCESEQVKHVTSESVSSDQPTSISINISEAVTYFNEMGYKDKEKNTTSPSTLTSRESTGTSTVEVEAPVSPSAYRSYLTRRTSQSFLSVAPSPPLEQDNYSGHSKINILQSAAVKSVKRQISQLKGQVKEFEMEFKCKHGYPPSMEQKMNSIIARPALLELNKLKKSLKDYKHDKLSEKMEQELINHFDEEYLKATSPSMIPSIKSIDCEENILALKKCSLKKRSGSTSDYLTYKQSDTQRKLSCNCSSVDGDVNTQIFKDSDLQEQLHKLQESMRMKRVDCSRPEEITLMTAGQIIDEKSDLQRELLKFESIYGHPDCGRPREIMRPIYDRYRSVKRLVASMPAVSAVTVSILNTGGDDEDDQEERASKEQMKQMNRQKLTDQRSPVNSTSDQVTSDFVGEASVTSLDVNESLEPIPENVSIDFKQSSSLCCSNSSSASNSCSSTSSSTKSTSGNKSCNTGVTLSSSTTNATIVAISPSELARIKKQQIIPMSKPLNHSGQKKHSFSLPGDTESIVGGTSDIIQYHEMSLMQLIEQLNRSRSEKNQLQRIIRNLEEEMRKKLGRKVEKEDRIQPIYITYKQVKGKLRLLKALVAKSEKGQHPSRMSL